MSGTAALVECSTEDGVARIRLDRPERRNSLTGPLVDQLLDAVRASRGSTQAILLSGSGRHFCAGLDLDEFNADPRPPWVAQFSARWAELHLELWHDDRPLVIEHRGAAIGGGAALLFAADLVVSGASAFAHVLELPLGVPAPVNLAWLLARHGRSRATEVVLRAERLTAQELHDRDLVTVVVEDDDLTDRCDELARRLAGYEQPALESTMRSLRSTDGGDFAATLATIREASRPFPPPRRTA